MTVPTTNVKFSDIWSEANGAYSSGLLTLNSMSFFSYFAGPNGSNSVPDNNWGQGEVSGANRIYGTSAKTTNIAVGDFDGLTYFYDNSTFQVTLNVTNNKTNPPPFPPPPVDNAVNVNVELWDSSFSYQYLNGGGMAMAPGTYGPSAVSQTNDPIIFRGYWKVTVSGAFPSFAGGTANLSINGIVFFAGQGVAAGSGGTTFTSTTFGTADVASYLGLTGLYFDVTVN
jgi:hypothetical protein